MTLTKEWDKLNGFRCEKGVLSLYLNTFESQGGQWQIRLKNGLKKLDEYIELAGGEKELRCYRRLKKKVSKEIHNQKGSFERGLLVFASVDGKVLIIKTLPFEVENEFHWEPIPVTNQLKEIKAKYPRSGIVVVQQRDILTLDVTLGEINEEKYFSFSLDDMVWKENDGIAATEREASSASHIDKMAKRQEENQRRWLKEMVPLLEQEAKEREWKGIYLVGPPEQVKDMKTRINTKVFKTITKNLFSKPNHEIIKEVI
ncbi:VLRF1 family aeRF1-type release factor [Alkalihalobacillus sp. LMS39]|uniref:VLRF1 family aeRF1-type release factor n=1 Tax=Alkalihalobacillus sp. LMS39 TaxID=2924032 RepID=UPI001FB556AD|nr:VLRF1 family aeRF1-type release factor [Alkalihalobacillus sp. LMS39]UOE94640.1 VLRF1 family aeRF1-type release factor [Alkalihalobacillus sp. LMS39]